VLTVSISTRVLFDACSMLHPTNKYYTYFVGKWRCVEDVGDQGIGIVVNEDD
jgi:hypothetical protein